MKTFINKFKCINKNKEITYFLKNNKLLIFLSIILILGMVFGSLGIKFIKLDTIKKLDFLFATDFSERNSQPKVYTFIASFSSSYMFTLLILIMSLSFFGSVTIPIIIFFRGIGLGITSGYLYLIYGLKGIAYHILMLLPGVFISSVAILLISSYAIKFSIQFASKITPKPTEDRLWSKLIEYLKKCSYLSIILIFSSIIDMIEMMLFSKFFNF